MRTLDLSAAASYVSTCELACLSIRMSRLQLLLFLSALSLALSLTPLSVPFRGHKAFYRRSGAGDNPGNPVYLTPYIKAGQLDQARTASQVTGILGLISYAGFTTVNENYNSNMYFWFFKAQNGNTSAPLLVWLQGGPGGSSLFGLFNENGPIVVDQNGEAKLRNVTWNSDYHMLYIDNPVGTGFSYTDKGGLSTTEEEVADNLYSCITQFLTVFSEYQASDFYVTGESYAGKYVPAIGYKIHTENQNNPQLKINFKGVAIGDGLVDPVNMLTGYADLAFQFGLADENQAEYINSETQNAAKLINDGKYYEAFQIFDMLLNGDLIPYPTYFYNITGSTNYFNILRQTGPPEFNYYVSYLNKTSIRQAIHVGNLSYGSQSDAVEMALVNDIMQSTANWLVALMDNYKVLLYNGQLDLIVGGPLTEKFLQVLKWSGQEDYLKVNRTVWRIGDEVAGYVRQVGKFMQVIVRGAGHILPYDQPERGLNLIQTFINMAD